MGEIPASSPLPTPVFMPSQSSRHAAPAPAPAPAQTPAPPPPQKETAPPPPTKETTPKPLPHEPTSKFPLPKLRLEIRDLNHKGATTFLTSVTAPTALQKAVHSVLTLLYSSPTTPTTTIPPTRSITLILRPMPGVAYTTGTDLDADHKEIHFSLDYIEHIAPSRTAHEIMGVLTHEMVHCYQYNAFGTCPGGLIEGVADWVRLNAYLRPPHWRREAGGSWDAGYQHTGYFLEYLERRFGGGLVRRLNEKLRIERYEEKRFWTELCGWPVEMLWGDYERTLAKEVEKTEDEECVLVEREGGTSTEGVGAEIKATPTKS